MGIPVVDFINYMAKESGECHIAKKAIDKLISVNRHSKNICLSNIAPYNDLVFELTYYLTKHQNQRMLRVLRSVFAMYLEVFYDGSREEWLEYFDKKQACSPSTEHSPPPLDGLHLAPFSLLRRIINWDWGNNRFALYMLLTDFPCQLVTTALMQEFEGKEE